MTTEPIIPKIDLELEKRTYEIFMNGNQIGFTVYGEEDDLNTLEMLLAFLVDTADNSEDDI